MNNTPESQNAQVPKRLPAPDCGWCKSSHVADVHCSCQTQCSVSWCAPQDEPMDYL